MNEDLIRQRQRDLEDNIRQDLVLLKEYEDALRLEDEPRRRAGYRHNIEVQRDSLARNEKEYNELKGRLTPQESQRISDLLRQKSERLADIQKLLPPAWNVQIHHNPNFTDREQILGHLRAALTSGEPDAWKQAITGLGGKGKTQIAMEYAYRHKADYAVIWWLHSEVPAVLANELAALATSIDLPEKDNPDQTAIIDAVRRWLEHNSGWLLIFDNAQDPKDLKDFLPRGGDGHVIITSHNPFWSSMAKIQPIEIFEREDSVKFLCQRTGQKDPAGAGALAKELGDLPLALEQAGAYIEEAGISFADYLGRFQRHRKEILERGKLMEYPDTVATAWMISWEAAKKKSPASADLLNLCSFLAPDGIPRSLLMAGRERLPERLASLDELGFDEAVAALRRYSLMNATADSLSIHRLVQAVTIDGLGEEDQKRWAEAAVNLLRASFRFEKGNIESWNKNDSLVPHILMATRYSEDFQISPSATIYLLKEVAFYLEDRANFLDAKAQFERALNLIVKAHGSNHPEVSSTLNDLGRVARSLGDLKEAKKLFERAIMIDEMLFGSDHYSVAGDLISLGEVQEGLRELKEARISLERAISIYGNESIRPEVAYTYCKLSNILLRLGDFNGAQENFEIGISWLDFLGQLHHHYRTARIDALVARAATLYDLRYYEEARLIYEEVLNIKKAINGPDHPEAARIHSNLGLVLGALNDLDGAESNLRRALEIDKKVDGSDSLNVGRDLQNLGLVYAKKHDLQNAEKSFRESLKISMQVYGPDSPAAAMSHGALGKLLGLKNDLTGARENLEKALEILIKVYGHDHDMLVGALCDLGDVLRTMGKADEAKKCYKNALRILHLRPLNHFGIEYVKERIESLGP